MITGNEFNNTRAPAGQEEYDGYTIPAAADLDGNGTTEIIVDCKTELLILDGLTGNEIYSFQHENLQACWKYFPHSPAVGNIIPESGTPQLEIALPVNNTLYILGIENNSLQVMDSFGIKPSGAAYIKFVWVSVSDIDAHLSGDEVVLSASGLFEIMTDTYWTRLGLYSYQNQGSFYTEKNWIGDYLNFNGIPAIGILRGSGERIALSQRLGNSTHNPAYIVDPDDMSSDLPRQPTLSGIYLCIGVHFIQRKACTTLFLAGSIITGWGSRKNPIL